VNDGKILVEDCTAEQRPSILRVVFKVAEVIVVPVDVYVVFV
jgi:hypothetical protein